MEHQAWVKLLRRKLDDTSSPVHTITRKDFEAIAGDCEAVMDMSCVNFSRELTDAFPHALIVIYTRDLDVWNNNCQTTFAQFRSAG
ncbi:P-loop containing nucleoside triphosphate hydrolase protein [Apiospora arundinis]